MYLTSIYVTIPHLYHTLTLISLSITLLSSSISFLSTCYTNSLLCSIWKLVIFNRITSSLVLWIYLSCSANKNSHKPLWCWNNWFWRWNRGYENKNQVIYSGSGYHEREGLWEQGSGYRGMGGAWVGLGKGGSWGQVSQSKFFSGIRDAASESTPAPQVVVFCCSVILSTCVLLHFFILLIIIIHYNNSPQIIY